MKIREVKKFFCDKKCVLSANGQIDQCWVSPEK